MIIMLRKMWSTLFEQHIIKRARIMFAVMLTLALAPLHDASIGEPFTAPMNLIANPDFAAGGQPWWGSSPLVLKKIGGKQAIEVTDGFVVQEKIPIRGGYRYRVTVQIAAQASPDNSIFVQASVRGKDVDPGWRGTATVTTEGRSEPALLLSGGTHEWRSFSAILQVPAGADQLLIYLRKVPGTPGKAYFTDVQVSPTDAEPTKAEDPLKDAIISTKMDTPQNGTQSDKASADQLARGKQSPASHTMLVNGAAATAVHVGRGEELITLAAAADLADYLGKIGDGAVLKLSSDETVSNLPLVVVGYDNKLAKALIPASEIKTLSDDGFLIRTLGSQIVIAGRTPRGTMYGVNWFMDHKLGIKWLSPTETFVPKAKSLSVPVMNERGEPRFAYRELLIAEAQDKAWRQHNLLNGESHGPAYMPTPPQISSFNRSWHIPGAAASFFELLPPSRYSGTHPDWYAGGQLAMMNPQMRAEMAKAVAANIRKLPDYKSVWYAISDEDWGWDLDPASRAFANKHGGKPSAPRLDMMIDVANQVRQLLPDAKFAFNAYHWSFSPPADMTVPDYIMVYPMTIQVDYSHPLNDPVNAGIRDGLVGWNRAAKHVLVWDHITNFAGFIQPTPNILPIAKSIQWLATLSDVDGYFAEGSFNTSGSEFANLRGWLFARLLWNPNQNVLALISQFCDLYYGPASEPVQKYIAAYHRKVLSSGDRLSEKTQADLLMFDKPFILEANSLFDQAEAAAKGTAFARHVREARIPLEYITLLRRLDYAPIASQLGLDSPQKVNARIAQLLSDAKEAKISQFYQSGYIKDLGERLRIERHIATGPVFPKGVAPKFQDIQDLSFNLYDNARISADPAASDGAAATIDGKNAGWYIQLKLDKLPKTGKWWVYASLRIEVDKAEPDAVHLGSAPPMNCFTTVSAAPGEKGYRWIPIGNGPQSYSTDHNKSLYIAPTANGATKRIWIDRLIATNTPVKFAEGGSQPPASRCIP